ncbi:hypothetical protein B14911_15182 [Bacillus sp. NRRL B-14911]|uniref:Uncharacterized protein n=1 Tax=Bacillus infantis NRRL B-14911 TaxID=1367477 RepID=U5L7B8_9BACI|nr:hypothetical protein N288_06475 [Bacillus infantis NRRL B-14911]EAR66722.1 hypothetical protein B14911_15182 [Bacillus sp. NRRL B-14911]
MEDRLPETSAACFFIGNFKLFHMVYPSAKGFAIKPGFY